MVAMIAAGIIVKFADRLPRRSTNGSALASWPARPGIHLREEIPGRLAARFCLLTGALSGLAAALCVNPSEAVQVLAVGFRPDALTRVDKSAVHVWQTPPETT
jgi:hypothetical protein